ncbi:hypothetical protein HPB50_022470 [Hyalomma asiaticum]|uniref:Uncharacterized protein n=1 Tax=Hyalomma asiaticum TaxID=266040 RepID=A0ACB7TKE7_HYAAI|nr:hypothetical protein HPB50_022470 [Hyalomma asiaticum]
MHYAAPAHAIGHRPMLRDEDNCSSRVHGRDAVPFSSSGAESEGGKPNDETEACATAACSLQPRGSPTGSPLAPSGDIGEEVAGLRRLLLDALEGISFLSDGVSQLREDNERLRKEHSRVAEQQVRIVASLRGEVRFLRDELTRRVAPKLGERLAKSPTAGHCESP